MAAAASSSEANKSFSMKMTIYGICKKYPSVRNISCDQLEKWRRENHSNLVILDTRPLEEYRVSHVPGAVQMDPQDEAPSLEKLGISTDAKIVCYCSVGYRSSVVAQKLFSQHKKRATETTVDALRQTSGEDDGLVGMRLNKVDGGKLDIYNLEGGIFQWACEERAIVNEEGEKMDTVHPYSSFWGKLLPVHLRHRV